MLNLKFISMKSLFVSDDELLLLRGILTRSLDLDLNLDRSFILKFIDRIDICSHDK